MKMVSTFSERLSDAMGDMSVTELAHKLGISKQSVSAYLNGSRKPKQLAISSIAQILSVDPAWLIGYDVDKHPDLKVKNCFPEGAIPIVRRTYKVLGNIACGEPVSPDQTQEVLVSPHLPEADFILYAHGDSMTGDRIHDGDLIFIRQQETADNGQIAAVLIDGETTLKHFYFYPETQTIALHPSNPAYRPMIYHGAELENIRVQGKVVAVEFPVK